jgi:HAD superfamily hydrolase (TIGR01549 family)
VRSTASSSHTVVFDLDGTLVEHIIDFTVIKDFLINFLGTLGIPEHIFEPEKNTQVLIASAEEFILRNGSTVEDTHRLRQKILETIEVFEWDAAKKTKVLPQVEPILKNLGKEYQLVVLSNVKTDIANFTLERFGLTSKFFQINGRDSVPNMKPNPSGLKHVLSSLPRASSKAVMVGDSTIDMIPAKELGILAIGVTTGISTRKDLEEAGANYVIPSLNDLPEILRYEFRTL